MKTANNHSTVSISVFLLLFYTFNLPAFANKLQLSPLADKETLAYASVKSDTNGPDFYSQLDKVFAAIFSTSGFDIKAVNVPPGPRSIASLLQGDLDMALIGIDKTYLDAWFPYEHIEIYPLAIQQLDFCFFVRRDSGLTINHMETISNYKLGMDRIPKEVLEPLLKQETGSVDFFSNHLTLAKALASQRVEVIIAGRQSANRAFRYIDIEPQLSNLGVAYNLDLHLLIRSSLPIDQKNKLYRFLAKRIPELKKKQVFEDLFTEIIAD